MLAAADGSWTSSSVAWLTATSAAENILLKAPSFHSVAAVNSWFFGQRPVSNTAKQINRQDKSTGPDFVVSAVSSMALRESSTGLSEAAGQRNPEYWPLHHSLERQKIQDEFQCSADQVVWEVTVRRMVTNDGIPEEQESNKRHEND